MCEGHHHRSIAEKDLKDRLEAGGRVQVPPWRRGRLHVPEGTDCSRVTELVLPECVNAVEDWAFAELRSLERVECAGFVSVGEGAFAGCRNLRVVAASRGVSPGRLSFEGCESLERVRVSSRGDHPAIGEGAFHGCVSLQEVQFVDEGITRIEEGAFQGCASLAAIRLPSALQSLGTRAFSGCLSLGTVRLPDSLATIGLGCFAGVPGFECEGARDARWRNDPALLGNDGPACILARAAQSGGPTWSRHIRRILWQSPEAARDAVRLLALQLASRDGMVEKEARNASAFVADAAERLEDAQLEPFLDALADRGLPWCADLCRDRRVARRFPDRVPQASAEDPAVREAYQDWRFSHAAADLRDMVAALAPDGVLYRDRSGRCGMDALVRLCAGMRGVVPPTGGCTDFLAPRDETAERIRAMLDPKDLGDTLLRLGASDGPRSQEAIAAFCQHAPADMVRQARFEDERKRIEGEFPADRKDFCERARLLCSEPPSEDMEPAWARVHAATADEAREAGMRMLGLQGDGTLPLTAGEHDVVARLEADLSISVLADGLPVAELPRWSDLRPDEREEVEETLRGLDDAVRGEALRVQCRLLDSMVLKEPVDPHLWSVLHAGDPVWRSSAERLVWTQGGRSFVLSERGPAGLDGAPHHLTEDPVRLAHPCDMDPAEVRAWRKHLGQRRVEQPFRQMHDPAERFPDVDPARYEGIVIPKEPEKPSWFYISSREDSERPSFSLPGLRVYHDKEEHALRQGSSTVEGTKLLRTYVADSPRRASHALGYVDRLAARSLALADDPRAAEHVDSFSAAELDQLVSDAVRGSCVAAAAALMERRCAIWGSVDPKAWMRL